MFGALAYASIDLTRGGGRIAVVWLPNALAVAFLLRARVPSEPLLLGAMWCANVLANLAAGDSLFHAGGLSTCNTVEIVLAVTLVRRSCGNRPDMADISDLSRFALFAGICAPLVSATMASSIFAIAGSFSIEGLFKWAAADALGMVLIAPVALILHDSIRGGKEAIRGTSADWLILAALGTGTATLVFSQTEFPLLFMITPVVVGAAFRLGSLGTAFAIAKTALIATLFTWTGMGPVNLMDGTLGMKLIVLQSFLVCAFVVGLPVAAILNGRRKVAQELSQRERQFSLLAENVSDAILRYDKDAVCIYVSPSTETVMGMPPEHFLGRKPADKTHPEANRQIADLQQRLISGETETERFIHRRVVDDADGNPVYIESDCAATRDPETGERDGIIVSARDITERVKLEQDLVRARRHAESAALAKSQFLANMSHEIRTPMNGVLGFAELLLQGGLKGEQHRHAELIAESGRMMMLLLNDILDISKIEAGQITITEETVDIAHLLAGCIGLHRADAEKKNLSLGVDIADDVPAHITCDHLRLRQIILNLLGNAVKFTSLGQVMIHAKMHNEKLLITVSDTGIGIDPERLERIFNPFEQADGAVSRNYGGTGLGLTISRQIAGLLGGELTVDSTPHIGSRFTLSMPVKEAEAGDNAPAADPVNERRAGMQMPPPAHILLVEDHDVNRLLMTAMLERCGQQSSVACDGQEAIAAVARARAEGRPFDLVLMDIQMPGCDGYSATRAIRGAGILPDELPIVALTANAFPEDILAAKESGMQAHLAKPVIFDELVRALNRWLPTKIVSDDYVAHLTSPEDNISASDDTDEPEDASPLQQRWQARRTEALDAVAEALRQGDFAGESAEDLARTVHKLAGTAGMFGEDDLGKRASDFERALKSSQAEAVCEKLAQDLLDAA